MHSLLQSALQWFTVATHYSATLLWLDTVIKATVLLLAAMIAATALRSASAAVRHRVWCLTFCSLLLLPALSGYLPQWRIPVLPTRTEAAPIDNAPARPNALRTDFPPARIPEGMSWDPALLGPPTDMAAPQSTPASGDALGPRPAPEAPVQRHKKLGDRLIGLLGPVSVWLFGFGVAVVPLAIGIVRSHRLCRRAEPVTADGWLTLRDEIRTRLGLTRHVGLFHVRQPLVPMTCGIVRPVVLIPREADSWSLRLRKFVLLHELAHVKRLDVAAQVLGRLVCAAYWFHPLAWYALKRLRVEREMACDDCVVSAGEQATDYARELLSIAQNLRRVRLGVAVAMARESNLELRVGALLDRARSHLPLHASAARLLLLAAAVFVTGVAILRPAPQAALSQEQAAGQFAFDVTVEPSEVRDLGDVTPEPLKRLQPGKLHDTNQPSESSPDSGTGAESIGPTSDDVVIVRGQVVAPDGSAAANATIYALRWYWSHGAAKEPLAVVRSSADGSFELSFRKSQFNVDIGKADQWKETAIVAVAEGFGFGYRNLRDMPDYNDVHLDLVPDEPIRGQIVDLEGNPMGGASVRVFRVDRPVVGTIDGFVEAVRGGEVVPEAFVDHLGSMLQVVSMPEFQAVQTDEDGRFRLEGIGRDRVAYLQVTGPAIGAAELVVVTRRMEPVSRTVRRDAAIDPDAQLYGAEIHVVTAPTRPIVGTIRDASSGDPIAGATVRATGSTQTVVEAQSDENGKYRLAGLPKKDGISVVCIGPPDEPYFNCRIDVPSSPGLEPVQLDIPLHRGVWITGHVTDKQTGEGLLVRVAYVPFLDNPHASRIRTFNRARGRRWYDFNWGEENRHDEQFVDGSFRVVGLPGHGLLGVRVVSSTPYMQGVGADRLGGIRYGLDDDPARVPIPYSPELMNENREIWHELEPEPATYEFRLERAENPTGSQQPELNAESVRRRSRQQEMPASEQPSSLESAASTAAPSRPSQVASQSTSDSLAVNRIQVSGTILDRDGHPMAGASVLAMQMRWLGPLWRNDEHRELARTQTDERGGFSVSLPAETLKRDPQAYFQTWQPTQLVVLAPGRPPAYLTTAEITDEEPNIIRVPSPGPAIEGRLLDLEGQPLPGVNVSIKWLYGANEGDVDKWLQTIADMRADGELPKKNELMLNMFSMAAPPKEQPRHGRFPARFNGLTQHAPGMPPSVATDAAGRFRISGLGRDRLAVLEISGPGIVKHYVSTVTRDMQPVDAETVGVSGFLGNTYYGAAFDHVVPPSRPIEGVVRDIDSGQPIAGAFVTSGVWPGNPRSIEGLVNATTDNQGRFRLEGLPSGNGTRIKVLPPADLPYFPNESVEVPAGEGLVPVSVAVELRRGVWIEGRVVERETGRGVKSTVLYTPLLTNKYAESHDRFQPNRTRSFPQQDPAHFTADDGSFRLVGIPGEGVIAVQAHDDTYLTGSGVDQIDALNKPVTSPSDRPTYDMVPLDWIHAVKAIEIPENAEVVDADIHVVPGESLLVRFVDQEGRPVSGARMAGRKEPIMWGYGDEATVESEVRVVGLREGRPRTIAVIHDERNVGTVVRLEPRPGETERTIQLAACATITGRIMDRDGKPLQKGVVAAALQLDPQRVLFVRGVFTDDEGYFRYAVPPGATCNLHVGESEFALNQTIGEGLEPQPGETMDLGEVMIEP